MTPTDIEAFTDGHKDAIAAAETYLRRARRGLPPDRWATGADGARMVAQGIMALQQIIAWQNDVILAMLDEPVRRGADAMELHSKDSPYHGR
jgi:hypothetical protein